MKPAKVLIVEDDLMIAADLQERLQEQGYQITGHAARSDEAIRLFRLETPDIVLLDIELKNSTLDGIELASALYGLEPVPILFLTSYSDRTFLERAKKSPAVDYVLKSAAPHQLWVALDMAFAKFYRKASPSVFNRQPASSCALYSGKDYFFVKQGHQYTRVEVGDIRWVESKGSAVKMITDAQAIAFSVKLKSFLEQVPHPDLVRTHRSWAVNLRYVTGFHRGRVMVDYRSGTQEIPLGDTYREAFINGLPGLRAD